MIGIFDSGIGGLTTVKALLERAPNASFIYLGDTARTPYGNKSPETIRAYAAQDAAFLIAKGATSLVIACNSASAVAIDDLRATYPNIPIFEVIEPAIEATLATKAKRVGVIGTRATIASGIYEKHLLAANAKLEVLSTACPLFVPLVEEGWLDARETKQIARRYLAQYRNKSYEALILGCTHYPLLKPIIQRVVGKRVKLIDSAEEVVNKVLAANLVEPGTSKGQHFFLTDISKHSVDIACSWLGRCVRFELAQI